MNKRTLTSLALLAVCGGTAFGQVNYWFHSGTDNAAGAGVSPDTTVDIGGQWGDTFLTEQNPDVAPANGNGIQANPVGTFLGSSLEDQAIQIWSFGDLSSTITSPIDSASLHLTWEFSNNTDTFEIWGYSGSENVSTMTWNNSVADVDTGTSYGSFSAIDSPADGDWFSIDITAAMQDYMAGTINAIAIGTNAINVDAVGTDNRIIFSSSEDPIAGNHPGLLVAVPEPSATGLFFGLSLLAFLGGRRQRRS
jgi:MYXO-CTERM domain-containing protein